MATAPKMSADEKRWRAEDDVRTLSRAEEIRADKERHGAAREHAAKEIARMSKVAAKAPMKSAPSKPAAKSSAKCAPRGKR